MEDFDSFVRANAPSLARFAYLLCGSSHTAEDLVQSTLLKVHQSWERVSSASSPVAYARRITVREYLSWRRRRSTSELVTDTDALPTHLSPAIDDPAHLVAETDAMWRNLQGLPRKQRTALVMRYYLDLPDREIAVLMGCSEATVRSHVSQGLRRLRLAVSSEMEGLSR